MYLKKATFPPTGAFWTEPPDPIFVLGLITFVVGYVLLGVHVLRGRSGLPRWSGLLLLVGAVVSSIPPVVVPTVLILTAGGVILGAGLAWIGLALWANKGAGVAA